MSTTRLALALNEVAAALLELVEGEAGPSSSGPAAAFAAAKPAALADPGSCPVHGVAWRTTKRDGSPAKRAFCSEKDDLGNFCGQKGPWLQSR